ncbi:MAG: hypothetical protein ACLQPD_02225 [Desulfomonilaceae bacterium]
MQRDNLKNSVRLLLIASAILVLILPLAALAQTSYNPCVVPPEIAFSAEPNILLVVDFSGSMQQQAYYSTTGSFSYGDSQALTEGTTVINAPAPPSSGSYDPTNPSYYFGLFDTTKYYTYDYTDGIFVSIGSTSASGSANVGTATVWSGTGSMPASGLSGALPNWALTSRIDSALKALIGGKSCDSTDPNATGYVGTSTTPVNCVAGTSSSCYLKAQGALRYVSETTNINAQFYIRPSTWTATAPTSSNTSANYPDDSGGWDSSGTCTSTAGSTCYPNRDLVVSINGYYNGALDTSKSPYYTKSSKKYYYDVWTFTLYQTTNVDISLTAAWPSSSNTELLVTNSANAPTTVTPGTITCSSSTCTSKTCCKDTNSGAEVQVQLSGTSSGTTYYVYAVDTNANPTGNTQIGTYAITSNVNLSPVKGYNALYLSSATAAPTLTTIGSIPYARVRVQIDPNSLTGSGVVRASWTKGRYGFMYYKGDEADQMGRILVPCGKYTTAQDMYDFIRKVQGEPASTDTKSTYDWQPWPYNGTPTGEAFNEVYNYLTQTSSSINSDVISKGQVPQDPYYTSVVVNGTLTPKSVSCRSTYVLHMSDGNWYNNSGAR